MKFAETTIPGVKIIEPKVFGDDRGYFMETFRQDIFNSEIGNTDFVQENQSLSKKNILRGLHYQIKQPQGKLVRVTHGSVFDVAVDLRQSSPTFKQWVGVELSAENKRQLWVPEGFAHGFCVLSETAEFVYKCTNFYAPEYDRNIIWNDPEIGIEWPLMGAPQLSEKDQNAPRLESAEVYS
ncbi:dTDP-4-dehydrorhamnose 3,5-epimerase [Microbulbifer agarilyticus]|uniref:dTDP-4-dehydrorhamnose 3,5-epimerase n=1 Tax=Microbulbifer agarilyticus TaxID=260552 RepID=UPI001CD4C31C|nr:dTDP-4-dehydrorhamnose 3,5-epimerase [Microbulbifer agarilyticus]MCA0901402.1 dTDP-4-dehydrorhamnose 3,5-epimerase [Microbulbifer agarilyticus]